MIQINNRIISSTDGKLVHRIGTDIYFFAATTIKGDSPELFEEVDEQPAYSADEYNAEVERLIALRYSTGQEIQFAREQEKAGEKYAAYLDYVEHCKAEAKERLTAQRADALSPDAEQGEELMQIPE